MLLRVGSVLLATCALATACGHEEPVRIRGNSLELIDTSWGKVIADVPVGRDPTRVAYGQGAFWVASPEAGVVVRVDPESKAGTRFHIGKDPYDVAIRLSLGVARPRGREASPDRPPDAA